MGRNAATLALGTKKASLAEVERRRSAAESLLQALEGAGLIPDPVRTLAPPRDAVPGYLRLPVLLPGGISGFPFPQRAKALGIAQAYPVVLTELGPLRPLHVGTSADCSGAGLLVRGLVTLPTHSRVQESDRERLVWEVGCYGT